MGNEGYKRGIYYKTEEAEEKTERLRKQEKVELVEREDFKTILFVIK